MQAAAWAGLLSANDTDLVSALPRALGFGEASSADAGTRRALGIPEDIESVRIAAGPGTARLLLVVGAGETGGRDGASRLATTLSRKSPHLLWLLVFMARGSRDLVIGAWHAGAGPARISALVVDRAQVLPSDVETMATLAAAMEGSDLAMHARWVEILGREAITRRFFLDLQSLVTQFAVGAQGTASMETRRTIALLHLSRMLFLAFLEARGWLDGDHRFLARVFDDCMQRGGRFQQRVLAPLFFGTLNTPVQRRAPTARALGRIPFLNGGLFSRAPVERAARTLTMRDDDWADAFDRLLVRYRFTPREETVAWREAAIDPEILGRAFESLMASVERRTTGAFYTPLALVERVTQGALEALVGARGVPDGTLAKVDAGAALDDGEANLLRTATASLRVIDPACGSGAFLIHVLDRLTKLRVASGDGRSLSAIRRDVVTRSVFGVDINPTAVWLCELRLWLALMVDHPASDALSVPPLPNLDHNIRVGDTLAGGDFALGRAGDHSPAAILRTRYARSTGARKRSLARALDRAERTALVAWLDARIERLAAQRCSLVTAARGRDLFGGRRGASAGERGAARQLRVLARDLRAHRRTAVRGGALPFAFASQFPDAHRAGGFDLVVGNPPWIRIHHIPAAARDRLRREFRVFQEAAWSSGATVARAGSGFGSQIDAASLFIERSHQLLREDGVLSLLVPSKLWRSLAGGGVRRLLGERASLVAVEDWSEAPSLFDAATYPSVVVARRATSTGGDVRLSVHRGPLQVAWTSARPQLPLDDSAGAPWLFLPPEVRLAFDRLTRAGVPLAGSGVGTTTLGVKCGCNEAFVVRAVTAPGGVEVSDGTRTAVLEQQFVRPVLRGEGVRPWRRDATDEHMVFPCAGDGRVLTALPSSLRSWLLPWRGRLEARTDARGNRAWWSLFRLDGARHDRPRVVWADLGKCLQALVLPAGDRAVPLNTCYVLSTRDETDALALAALFNSPVADAWVAALAEPARGGYRRHFAWTMARVPVPDDWARARDVLAPLGRAGMDGSPSSRTQLMHAVLEAFRLRRHTVAALVEWMNR